MAKNHTTKQAAADDLHARIQREAKAAREAKKTGFRAADQTPALAELMAAATDAIYKATPSQVMVQGRMYWVRCSIGLAHLELFDNPAQAQPLITGICGNMDHFGHAPHH